MSIEKIAYFLEKRKNDFKKVCVNSERKTGATDEQISAVIDQECPQSIG